MTIVTDSRKVRDSDEMFAKLLEPKEYAPVVGACIYISTTCRPDISQPNKNITNPQQKSITIQQKIYLLPTKINHNPTKNIPPPNKNPLYSN